MKETMTSRQRVINAVEHKQVDRFPIDLGMHWSTGISAFAYKKLREYLGLSAEIVDVPEPCQFLARVEEDVLKRFHIDTAVIHPGFKKTRIWNPRGNFKFRVPEAFNPILQADGSYVASDGTSVGLRMPRDGYFFDGVGFDFWQEDEVKMLQRYGKESERIFNETDYFTMFIGYSAYYAGEIMFSCDMLTEPEESLEKIKQLHKFNLAHVKKLIKYCGKNIQGICIGGDLGTQSAPLMNPNLYEEMIHPYMVDFIKYIKQNSDYKVFMHSCGAVREFIPYFIEEGIDVLNPVQVSAAGMEPEKLKKDFGNKITFWGGGCNTQQILNLKGVDEVKQNTKYLCNIFKENSGFIFNQVHNIMGDIAPEKITVMLDTAYENSFYENKK